MLMESSEWILRMTVRVNNCRRFLSIRWDVRDLEFDFNAVANRRARSFNKPNECQNEEQIRIGTWEQRWTHTRLSYILSFGVKWQVGSHHWLLFNIKHETGANVSRRGKGQSSKNVWRLSCREGKIALAATESLYIFAWAEHGSCLMQNQNIIKIDHNLQLRTSLVLSSIFDHNLPSPSPNCQKKLKLWIRA